tara:strand:+ start:289 stop:540 length:252 start_codon:yes stop_codon:yes gene_type:complete
MVHGVGLTEVDMRKVQVGIASVGYEFRTKWPVCDGSASQDRDIPAVMKYLYPKGFMWWEWFREINLYFKFDKQFLGSISRAKF